MQTYFSCRLFNFKKIYHHQWAKGCIPYGRQTGSDFLYTGLSGRHFLTVYFAIL